MDARLDHVGIAVRDLAEAIPRWERTIGVRASPPEEVSPQRVRVCFLPVGDSHLELLEPTAPESTVARFLEKRGEGLHHVAFAVPDLRARLDELRLEKVRLIDENPRRGARGRWVAFAHPSHFGGVLTEFVEAETGESP